MDSNINKTSHAKAVSPTTSHQVADDLKEQVSRTWTCRSSAIAQRVLSALQARKMMQKELAMTIGFRPQQVSRILRGNVNLTIKTIAKLEAALGIHLLEVPADDVGKRRCNGTKRSSKPSAAFLKSPE